MLRLVLRRALAQRRLLVGVVALVAVGTTFLGVCALLLDTTQDRAFTQGMLDVPARDVEVDAFLVEVAGPDVAPSRDAAETVLRDVLAPLDPVVTSTADTRMRVLDAPGGTGPDRVGYLAGIEDRTLRDVAVLTSGRWTRPVATGTSEAVVPEATARRLHLTPGDLVTLGKEVGTDPAERPLTVVVTGTFRPRTRAGWEHDTLAGAGFDPAWSDGSVAAAAYGPFVVDDAALLASGSTVSSLQVTGRPRLAGVDDATLGGVVTALGGTDGVLSARVGDRVRLSRVGSDLPTTLDRVRVEQATTRSTVEVVLLLGTVAALTALLLAGRLVGAVRDEERRLLVSLGLGRRQLALATAGEAVVVAALAAVVAVPAAAVLHALVTRLPALEAAGLAQGPGITVALVVAVVVGALLGAVALVATVLAGGEPVARPAVPRSVRVGGDLVLALVAVGAWWQLSGEPATPAASGDLVLTAAPVVAVLAVSLLVVRWVPAILGSVAAGFDRSRGLVVPLAVLQAARRPRPATALVLLTVAAGAATFGLTMRSTWEHSQVDQAALRVGTDLSLALSTPATPGQAAAITAAAGAGSGAHVSPVVARSLALGRYTGGGGSPPVLVAVDARRAGSLLRGRSDQAAGSGDPGGWAATGAELAPDDEVQGLPVPTDGAGLTLTGQAPDGAALLVTPTLVLQDATGFRSAVEAGPVRLDGRARPVRASSPIGSGQSLVAVRLQVGYAPGAGVQSGGGTGAGSGAALSVDLVVPAPAGAGNPAVDRAGAWQVRVLDQEGSPAQGARVVQLTSAGGTVVRTTALLDPSNLAYTEADLLATTFAAPTVVPVAVSQELADATGARVGGDLSATIAQVALTLHVVAVVPAVPSAPGRVAVLADVDTLSRALLAAGSLDQVVDGWWVADPPPGAATALRALDLGEVTTRAGTQAALARGPLRVTIPTALLVLVVTAALLFLAGTGLLLGADQDRRSGELARLRALGLSRRGTWRLLLVEHAAVLVPLLLLGSLVGAAGAALLGPALVRSDAGTAPAPAAVVDWPWGLEVLLVAGLLVGCLLVAAVVAVRQVRGADPAHLRGGR